MNDIITGIIELKIFIIVSAIGTLLCGAFLLLACRKFQWEGKNRKWIGFFYELGMADSVPLAVSLLKFFLLFSVLITGGHVELVHIILYLMLELLFLGWRGTTKGLLSDIVMGVVTTGVLVVMQLLYHYLHEIIMDGKILTVVILLGILVSINAVADIFRSGSYIMVKKGNKAHGKTKEHI
ncbi:hypothetical protein ACTQ1U_02060 [Thermoguttaceae bacterium LCP21S3_D4]